jgi:uncharacterized protein involved in exopolysaccharide biosynthesis
MFAGNEQNTGSEIAWQDLLAMVFRRKRMILRIGVVGLVLASIYAWMQPPVYRADGKIMLRAHRAQLTVSPDAGSKPMLDRVTESQVLSEAALLRSETLLREVLAKHTERYEAAVEEEEPSLTERIADVVTFPLKAPRMLYAWAYGLPEQSLLDRRVQSTAEKLWVKPVDRSNLIQVSYVHSNPEWAAQFVNELLSTHITRNARMNEESSVEGFFRTQRQRLEAQLAAAETSLKNFREREGAYIGTEDEEALRARLAELEAERADAERNFAEVKARVEFLTDERKVQPESISIESRVSENQSVLFLKSRLLELQMQKSELLSRYAPTSTIIREIDRQIADATERLEKEKATVKETVTALNPAHQTLEVDLVQQRAEMASLEARIGALVGQIADYRARLSRLEDIAAELDRLQNQVVTAKESYLTYLKKEEEARFSNALDESKIVNVAIAEAATVPRDPEPVRRVRLVLIGFIMSLLVGAGVAFLIDRMDPSVKSSLQAQRVTGLPVLTEIPS